MSNVKVSIGMPVYNGEEFIREALDSLLAQTFTDFELIISDNASTDSTEVICRDYAAKYQRISYVRQSENLGPVANFQFVLDTAVGKYFMWAGVDDRRDPKFLEYALEVFDSDSNTGLVFSEFYYLNLGTAERKLSSCGYTTSNKKYQKYLFRLLNSCPDIIYGLHNITILRKIRLKNFDCFDHYLVHWYELNSVVKIVPLPLYIRGIRRNQIPYSLTGTNISVLSFIRAEKELLADHFPYGVRLILLLITCYLFLKTARSLNRLRHSNIPLHSHLWDNTSH